MALKDRILAKNQFSLYNGNMLNCFAENKKK
jgi:hypothetical protein